MPALRLAVTVGLAVLASSFSTWDCSSSDGRCAAGEHSLLQSTVTIAYSKRMESLVAQEMDLSRAAVSFDGSDVPPVSTTMKCVITITVLYFVIWTSLFLVTSAQNLTMTKYEISDTLGEATHSVQYAPMISVLFIVTRMRAIAVTNGDTERWGLPQWWCKDAMVVASACVVVLTLVNIAENSMSAGAMGVLTVIQYAADACLYSAYAVVCYGLFSMDAPPGLGQSVPISDTAKCIAILTIFYFAVQIVNQLGTTMDVFRTRGQKLPAEDVDGPLTGTTKAMLRAMDLAPQVCILFLAARMRALQIGLDAPQPWARLFFFGATYSVLVLSVLAAFAAQFEEPKRPIVAMEAIILCALYFSTAAVISSVLTIEAPPGNLTPGISTTVRIVMGLTVMYFFVYASLFIAQQMDAFASRATSTATKMFEGARAAIMFCPMICALFVGVRMRALQLTHNQGAPQGWAQDCMMIATWAILFDLVSVIAEHMFSDTGDGGKNIFSTVFSNVCLFAMHGSVIAVIVSLFFQTPENANNDGGIIPGFKIPGRM